LRRYLVWEEIAVLATKAGKDNAVFTVTSKKLDKFLKDLNQDEREAVMAIASEVAARARLLAEATQPASQTSGPRSRSIGGGIHTGGQTNGGQTELMDILVGLGLPIAAKMIGGVAGWLSGGGSASDIPWGDIYKDSV